MTLILRQFPDPKRLTPLPKNDAYRRAFYSRWGVETCVVLARTRHIEFPLFTQRLSIKCASGGRERYLLTNPCREVDVDDDNYLIVNDGRTYGSRVASEREVESYSIFFRPGFAKEVRRAIDTPVGCALEGGGRTAESPEFQEFLQPHDRRITPVLNYIRQHVRMGVDDPAWYEEQLYFLLDRMIEHRQRVQRRVAELPVLRRTTKAEVYRRVMLAADYIHSHFDRDVRLDTLAAEACLSKYHFLRLFCQVMGVTPYAYLQRKRARVAQQLIISTGATFDEIAPQVGFESRSSLFRQVRRWLGCNPSALRRNRGRGEGVEHGQPR